MKITLLITLTIFIGLSIIAQQNNPEETIPSYNFQLRPNLPSKSLNTDHISGRMQNTYISPLFDTTWANQFQTALDNAVEAGGVKGASAAVLVPGQGLWTGVSGISHEDTPISSEMRFAFASNTKLYIAVTLAKLQEDGVLSLDDQLHQWLPAYPYVDSTATIRQLLSHQTGTFDLWNDQINFFWDLILDDTSHFFTPDEILATIGDPHFEPGHGYRYSNTNYLLAGMVIEAATGSSWVDKLHDIIFDPLSMDSTFVGAFEPSNGPVVHEWVWSLGEDPNTPMTSAYTATNASAAIMSTPQEMVAWYNKLFNGEIISEASLEEVLNFETTSKAGLGIFETMIFDTHYNYVHGGAMIGCLSQMAYDVETNSAFCIVTNNRDINFNNLVVPMVDVWLNQYPKHDNDAGITKIISPWESSCDAIINPSVSLKNFGNTVLNSTDINYQIDTNSVSILNWTGSLNPGEEIEVLLPEIIAVEGDHSFIAYTSSPNGFEEGYIHNDSAKSYFHVNTTMSEINMLTEGFESDLFPLNGWSLSSSSMYQWGQTTLSSYSGTGSLVKSNYDDYNIGSFYDLNLPKINISGGTDLIIDFTYAYAMYPGRLGDSLQILISNDCGLTWQKLYDKGGLTLYTTSNKPNPYYPQSADEWRDESILVDSYAGDVLIKLRAISGRSNNLYIDDLSVGFVTSAPEDQVTERFRAYPNPFSNEIHISGLPINSEVQITSLSGKLLLIEKINNGQTLLEIEHLPKGVYILNTVWGNKKIVKL